MPRVKQETFASETEMCAEFMRRLKIRHPEWTPYPETGGWDILLARVDGYQIGVQAKLKFNADVLLQAAEDRWQDRDGPDYRAVLVPSMQGLGWQQLAYYCGLTVIRMTVQFSTYEPGFRPGLPDEKHTYQNDDWLERCPVRRCQLPEYVPDVRAGASSPIQLTTWKIGALKLAILLDATGYLTRTDFKEKGIDIRRWIGPPFWLRPSENGFVRGDRMPDFRLQHPVVWEQIVSEPKKWQRAVPLMVFGDGSRSAG